MNPYQLKLLTSVKKAVAELAATVGVSLNQFIASKVAEKVGFLHAADDFLRERAGTAKHKDMLVTQVGSLSASRRNKGFQSPRAA